MDFSPIKQLLPMTIFPKKSLFPGNNNFAQLSCVQKLTPVETVVLSPISIKYDSGVNKYEHIRHPFPIVTPPDDKSRTSVHVNELAYI